MAADKLLKKRKRAETPSAETPGSVLITRTEPRTERRYEPKASVSSILTLIGAGLGAALAGAGVYAQWLRPGETDPHTLAPYLLAAGAALLIAVAFFGQLATKPLRVGDAGVGMEKDAGEIERIPWNRILRVNLAPTALSVQASGTRITVPLSAHPQAAARILAEAKARIPARVEDASTEKLEKLDDAAGELITLEPPQAAGLRCKNSDKLIAFERDARFCGRCGEIYHKDGIPKRCVSCEAPLR
jgi:hypothetical protein